MDLPRPSVAPEELAALAELVYLALDAVEAGERPEAEDLLQRALATLANESGTDKVCH